MRAHSANAQALAEAIERHPKVARVYYPGLASHPDHALARRMFRHGCSGMLSFTLDGGLAEADRLIRGLRRAVFAPSLAGVATSVSHPAKTSHRAQSAQALAALDIHDGTVRVSVGIEDVEDIVEDFQQALDQL
jgi:cystathionine gamma-synthase